MYEDNSNKLASTSSSSPMSSSSSSPEVQATKQQQPLIIKTEAPSSSCSTSLDDLDDLTDLLQIPPSEFAMEDLGDLFARSYQYLAQFQNLVQSGREERTTRLLRFYCLTLTVPHANRRESEVNMQ